MAKPPVRFGVLPGLSRSIAVERGGEAVGIALAPLLAIGDDVEAGALLVADGQQRGVVLRRFELLRDRPARDRARAPAAASAWRAAPVDQPVRLRIGAD